VELLSPDAEALGTQELNDQIRETLPGAEEQLLLYCENWLQRWGCLGEYTQAPQEIVLEQWA